MQRPSSSSAGSAQASVPSEGQQHKKHIPSFEELDEHCEQRPHSYQPSTEAPSAAAQSSVRARASERSGSISSLSDNNTGSVDGIEKNNKNNDDDDEDDSASAVSSNSSQFNEENNRYFTKGEFVLIPTECFSRQVSGQQQLIHESDLEACAEEKEENKRGIGTTTTGCRQQVEVQQKFNAEGNAAYDSTDQEMEGVPQHAKRRIDRKTVQEQNGGELQHSKQDGDFLDEEALKNLTDAQLKLISGANCLTDYGRSVPYGNQEQIMPNQALITASNSQMRMKTDPPILRDSGGIDCSRHDRGGLSERQASQTYSKANHAMIYQQQQQEQDKPLEDPSNEINRRQLQILEIEKQKVQKLLLDKQRRLRLHEIQQQSQQHQQQFLQGQIKQPQLLDHNHQQQIDTTGKSNNNNNTHSNLIRESAEQERMRYADEELRMIKDENKKLSKKLQVFLSDHKQISEELEVDLEQMHPSQQQGELLKRIKALKAASKQDKKFITCILDMVESCTSPVQQGNKKSSKSGSSLESSPGQANEYGNKLKTAWKWLKFIMEDYVAMKRAHQMDKPTKNSNMYKSCLLENSSSCSGANNNKAENIPGASSSSSSSNSNTGNGPNGQSSKSDAIVIAEINAMLGTESKYDMLRAIKEIMRQNQLLHSHINGNNNNAFSENANIPQQFSGLGLQYHHSQSSSRLTNLPISPSPPIIPSVPLHHPTIFSPCSSSAAQLQRHYQQQQQPQSSSSNQLQQYPSSKGNKLNQSPAPSLDSQQYIQQKILSGNVSPQKSTPNIAPPNSQNEIPSLGCQTGMFRQNSAKLSSTVQQQQMNFIQIQSQQNRQPQLSPPPKQVVTSSGLPNAESTGNTRVNTVHLSPRSSVQTKQQHNQKEGLPAGNTAAAVMNKIPSSSSSQQQQSQQHQQYLGTFQQPGNYFPNPYLQFGQK